MLIFSPKLQLKVYVKIGLKRALHYLKTFKDLDLKRGDVVEFEGMVEKDSNNGFTIERPTQAEKIRSAAADDAKVDVVGDDWNWFEN